MNSKKNKQERRVLPSLLSIPTIEMDLTLLVDPPLLSEWIPGLDTRIHYGTKEEEREDLDNERQRNVRPVAVDGTRTIEEETRKQQLENQTKWNELVTQVISNILRNKSKKNPLEKHIDNECRIEKRLQQIDPGLKSWLKDRSVQSWLELLPSHALTHQIQKISCEHHESFKQQGMDEEANWTLSQTVTVFLKLIHIAPHPAFGQHVLQGLFPSLCVLQINDSSNEILQSRTDQKPFMDISLEKEASIVKLKELARALIYDCQLGSMTKAELRSWTSEIPAFRPYLSKAHFEARRSDA